MAHFAKLAVFRVCKFIGLFALARKLTARGVRIICYHGLATQDECWFKPKMFMRPETFRRRLAWLKEMDFPILRLQDAIRALETGSYPDGATVVTIDDGWHSTYKYALPILREMNIPATVYMSTYYMEHRLPDTQALIEYALWRTKDTKLEIAEWPESVRGPWDLGSERSRKAALAVLVAYVDAQPPETRVLASRRVIEELHVDWHQLEADKVFYLMDASEVKELAAAGVDIQLHTHRHRLPMDDRSAVEREVQDNRRALSPLTGRPLVHLAYPKGDYHPCQFAWLEDLSIISATTCLPGLNYSGTPRLELRRFLDGEDISDVEFEAELSGIADFLRKVARPTLSLRKAVS